MNWLIDFFFRICDNKEMRCTAFVVFIVILCAIFVPFVSKATNRHRNNGITFAAQLIDPKHVSNVSSILRGVFQQQGDMAVYRLIESLEDLQNNSDFRQAYARALNLKQAINMRLQQMGDPNPRLDFIEGEQGAELFRKQHQQVFGAVDPNTTVSLQLLQHLFA